MTAMKQIAVGRFDQLADPGCREFQIGGGDWPFRGFIVRQGENVFAYQNNCKHVGHALNWMPDSFLSKDREHILCASHGALYEIGTGLCIAGPCLGRHLVAVEAWVADGEVCVRGPDRLR